MTAPTSSPHVSRLAPNASDAAAEEAAGAPLAAAPADPLELLEQGLGGARPRLLALARLRGLSDEDAEEVAQETLVTAWRRLESLRDPLRFDAWLDGICRTLSLRLVSARARQGWRVDRLALGTEEEAAGRAEDCPDPAFDDLAEDLCRADLHAFLDRALAHLSAPTRAVLVLAYLEEVPQREVAARLGLSLSALEARLHRARGELRQVLAGPLRAEAESFGLLVGCDEAEGWRESREWCIICGQHRMRGIFERMPDGSVSLRMRCPGCSRRWESDIVNSGGIVPLDGLRSFRPALARLFNSPRVHQMTHMLPNCPLCNGPARKQVRRLDPTQAPRDFFFIVTNCPRCGLAASHLANVSWAHPATRRWVARHARYVLLPGAPTTFNGLPAIRESFAAVTSTARLDIFIEPTTLTVLGVVEE